jgi:hypothetical protein
MRIRTVAAGVANGLTMLAGQTTKQSTRLFKHGRGDPPEDLLGDDTALLPTPDGAVCVLCGKAFRPVDDVRATGQGPVHEACPV